MAVAPEGSAPGETGPGEAEEPAARQEQEKDDGQWVTVLLFARAREAAGTGPAYAQTAAQWPGCWTSLFPLTAVSSRLSSPLVPSG